jgi:hypothetical protein
MQNGRWGTHRPSGRSGDDMQEQITIIITRAELSDAAGMAAFLAPMPNSDGLAALLVGGEPVNTRAFDDENLIARFVVSDGSIVTCCTVNDITIDQAEMITIACEQSDDWSTAAFPGTVQRALGDGVRVIS